MSTLIVYYSLTGNCEYAAWRVSEKLGADTLRIEPVEAYPSSGFRKYFWGGKSAVMGDMPDLLPYSFDPEKYERIIFCFPVWAGNPVPPIRTFIRDNLDALKGKKLAAVLCYSGGGADKALMKLKKMLGVTELESELVLVDPKDRHDSTKDIAIEEFVKGLGK